MAFGLSFRVAPGIRIRATPRGVRASVGPRAARVHIGGGRRTRVSSGIGPFSMYGDVGSQSRATPRGSVSEPPTLERLARESAAAERANAVAAVARLEQDLLTVHLAEFAAARKPVLPAPPPQDVEALIAAHTAQALDGLSLFDLASRRVAKQAAQEAGVRDAQQRSEQAILNHARQQAELDECWNRLIAHDEEVVHDELEDAFEDNQSPATCLDVGRDTSFGVGARYATVLLMFGPLDLVPERRPAVTSTGQPTLQRRTKSDRNDFYLRALGSTVLATVKEGLAVAPSVTEIRIVVLRKDPRAACPDGYIEWIYGGRFPRQWVETLPWAAVDTAEILLCAPDAQLQRRGVTGQVVGLPIEDEPGLAQIVATVRDAS